MKTYWTLFVINSVLISTLLVLFVLQWFGVVPPLIVLLLGIPTVLSIGVMWMFLPYGKKERGK